MIIDFPKTIDRDRMNYYIINKAIERNHGFNSNIENSLSGRNFEKSHDKI